MKKGTIIGIVGVFGGIAGILSIGKMNKDVVKKKDQKIDKFKSYYNMLNQWLCISQNGRNLSEYFEKNNLKRIAVYGMGEMGGRLIDELKESKIVVEYGIDKNVDEVFSDITVYALDEVPEKDKDIDAIVVTAIFAYDDIQEDLKSRFDCQIISLEDVVYES